ncbi:hydroxyphenylacetyl-CoA thioesterase PaaI [Lentzea sp. NPDC004782]|uniref:hydroxyphenylacetyl-CoA thioesterase PaaI n=1 Tax=Lentzea sp. NPDC004782 TaxID=3154458 RepID=UPI0033B691AD
MFGDDAVSRSLGIELLEFGDGRSSASMRVTDSMVNGHAVVHGGYVFLLAETAFAYACNSRGPATVTTGAEISFVAAAEAGDLLIATAEERTRFGRNGIYDVTVRRGDTVIAEFRGRSRTSGRVEGEA